jgi:hypothetical protein
MWHRRLLPIQSSYVVAPLVGGMVALMADSGVVQSGTGVIIAQWPSTDGAYAVQAHQAAMMASICIQLVALAWFARPRRVVARPKVRARRLSYPATGPALATHRVRYAATPWPSRHKLTQPFPGWHLAATASAILCVGVATALALAVGRPAVAIHVLATDHVPPIGGNWTGSAIPTLPVDLRLAPEWEEATVTGPWRSSVGLQPMQAQPWRVFTFKERSNEQH